MSIVRFALKYPYTFYVLAASILFVGVSAITVMPEDIFPEIDIPVVSVIWQYTGLSVPEMEQRVTTYSQYSMSANVTGIKNMEAQTLNGISVQKVYFQPDVSLDLAISQIVAATNLVRAVMPTGIQPPIVVKYDASSVPVLQLSLSSDRLSEQQLYDYGLYTRSLPSAARSPPVTASSIPAPS
jgi:multidrug efflux pump subunit AcrB